MPRTVLVIGGGAAGLGAARAAAVTDPAATVALYAADLPAGTDERLLAARRALGSIGVQLRSAAVRALDRTARTLSTDGADPIRFDALVLTDSPGDPAARRPDANPPNSNLPNSNLPNLNLPNSNLPGADLDGVTADPGLAARSAATRAVVLGATPSGLVTAAELAARGVETHLVDPGEQLLAGTADPDVVAPVADRLAAAGLHLHLSTTVEALLGTEGRLHAVRTSAGELPADLAVLASTPAPDAGLAAAAGLDLDPDGRLVVDDRMRTSDPAVFAAGDLCAPPGPPPGRTSSHAYAQGRVAGSNAAGGDRRYHAAYVPWGTATGVGVVGGAGFGEVSATALGLRYVLARGEGISRARYYPGVQKVVVKLLAEPGSLRLIGAQLQGEGEGVRERANFLAQAVRLGLTLHDLSTMENVYSPAIGALNEPIVVAATNGLIALATAS